MLIFSMGQANILTWLIKKIDITVITNIIIDSKRLKKIPVDLIEFSV